MIRICLATEDVLSEAAAEKLLTASGKTVQIAQRLRRDGYGYLKTNLPKFNQVAANVMPVFLLTDLDAAQCVVDFIRDWRKGLDLSERLLFRVAVREVEAWLMADRRTFANWLGISADLVPAEPERLDDPKRELLRLVDRSKKRELKAMILPEKTSSRPIGLGYNTELTRYVRDCWNPQAAAASAPSLARALKKIEIFF
uniref:hypothetical protein n=1 Tax=Candidatus Electronema sp. TaxID=2698783 RepID=UPI004056E392